MPISIQFDEEELNRDYTEVATGGPTFDTGVIGNPVGVQQRAIRRQDAIRTWDIQFEGLSEVQLMNLQAFFITKYGGGIGFRFVPPSDNHFGGGSPVSNYDIVGTTNSGNSYTLNRTYRSAARNIQRRITKPFLTANQVTGDNQYSAPVLALGTSIIPYDIGGVMTWPTEIPSGFTRPGSPSAVISMNFNTGVFSFVTSFGASIPTDGQTIKGVGGRFHVPCVFETDKFETSDYGVFSNLESIRLVELLPAALGL